MPSSHPLSATRSVERDSISHDHTIDGVYDTNFIAVTVAFFLGDECFDRKVLRALRTGPPVYLGGIHTAIVPRARLLTIYRHGAPANSRTGYAGAIGASRAMYVSSAKASPVRRWREGRALRSVDSRVLVTMLNPTFRADRRSQGVPRTAGGGNCVGQSCRFLACSGLNPAARMVQVDQVPRRTPAMAAAPPVQRGSRCFAGSQPSSRSPC
jgi:hypothetical protein